MAKLSPKLLQDYFGGSWAGKVFRNGEFTRDVFFQWPLVFGEYAGFSTNDRWMEPSGSGDINNLERSAVAGWRDDANIWYHAWHNEFGGYGELKWNSLDVANDVDVIYGSVHECEKEGDDPADYIAMCELLDENHFKYTLQSYRKGILEVSATRVDDPGELAKIREDEVVAARSFDD